MFRNIPSTLGLSAPKAAGLYLVFGVVWIAGTDWLVLMIATTESELVWLQSIKGWVFVGLSTLLIFGLVSFRERQINFVADRLKVSVEQLQVIHRVFRHNLRNELMVFRGYVDAAARRADDRTSQDNLIRAGEAAKRIERINERLRIIEHDREPTNDVIDLAAVLQSDIEPMAQESLDAHVEFDYPENIRIHGDESITVLIQEIIKCLSDRSEGVSEMPTIRIVAEPSSSEVHLRAITPDVRIRMTEIEPLEAAEEEPLNHASGVRLWVIKWLANYYRAEVEITSSEESTQLSVSFPKATFLDRAAVAAEKQIEGMMETSQGQSQGTS